MACRILPRPEHLDDVRNATDAAYRRLADVAGAPTAAGHHATPAASPKTSSEHAAVPPPADESRGRDDGTLPT